VSELQELEFRPFSTKVAVFVLVSTVCGHLHANFCLFVTPQQFSISLTSLILLLLLLLNLMHSSGDASEPESET